ncbi:MAG: PD40 domain-containing protein [Cyanosarcina radialis HA8281-LM2]|jgi:WD40 repeat protein|nr:PD40 domain-containing protein [Cyanosarcina radialis HA8281-LM2]
MGKLATLRLLDGDLDRGLRVLLTIDAWDLAGEVERPHASIEVDRTLPPNPALADAIDRWESNYRSLGSTRIRPNKTTYDASINQRRLVCQKLEKLDEQLRSQLNTWLSSPSFSPIRDKWLEELMKDEVRVLIRTSDRSLLKLPWHLWDLIERNPLAEVALSAIDREHTLAQQTPTLRGKVKILAILGNSKGIDIEKDRQLLANIAGAETSFLVEPQRREINDQLWDRDWDILFFAGHSETKGDRGIIYINQTDSLTISDLKHGLQKAVDKGLQLAIFNSCDGTGLAFELEQLHLPLTIVMREPVHDEIAQEFLRYFLPAFASGRSLYLAEREARLRLQGREDEFPGASWLPAIFQSPAIAPPTWADLGRRPTSICPYRGLFAFREEDALFFHGRESFTQILVEAVQRHSFVSVIGASGSGKSSVVFAGLVAELRQQSSWEIAAFRPGQRPLQAIATAWVKLKTPALSPAEQLESILQLAETWSENETALYAAIEEAIWQAPGTKLLIVIDQFEELYTQCQDVKERQTFIDRLLKVTELTNVALVLTLRTDFLGQALAYPSLADVLQHGNRMLGGMSRAELQSAIDLPAGLLGVTIEAGLTERIVEAASNADRNLPLLEFALQQLWEKRQGVLLTHAAYEEIGGLEAAIARHAERTYDRLNDSEKERSRPIFLQLVRPGEGTVDTRRVATRTEIGDDHWGLVTRLASDRLLVTGQDAIGQTETVELIHEALISQWSRLQGWIEENRDFRLWQERLRAAMQQWEKSDRDRGALLQGKLLSEAETWWQKRSQELTAEREFIAASAADRQRYKRQKILIFGSVSAIGLLLAIVAGVAAWQTNTANVKAQLRELVAASETLFKVYQQKKKDEEYSQKPYNTEFKQKQDLDRLRQDSIDSYQDALLAALKAGRTLEQTIYPVDLTTRFQVITTLNQAVYEGKFGTKIKYPGCEFFPKRLSISMSADRKAIACSYSDGTVRLFNSLTGKELNVFKGDANWVNDIRFSPDGKTMAFGTIEGDVHLWNLVTKKIVKTLKGHHSEVSSLGFSPDGQVIAAGTFDGLITLWNISTGQKLKTLNGRSRGVHQIQFSPDGQTIAFVGVDDGKIKLWNIQTDKLSPGLPCKSEVRCNETNIYFGTDDRTITYSGDFYDATLWDIKANREIKTIKGKIGENQFVSPDGKIAASGVAKSGNNTVILRDVSTGKILKTLNAQAGQLSPQSLRWKNLYGTGSRVNNIGFSPDGKSIVVASADRTMTLWDSSKGTKLKTFQGLIEWTGSIDFSPNGKLIATTGMDSNNRQSEVKLWDISTGKLFKTLIQEPAPSEDGISRQVRFSPDSQTIAVISSDSTVRLWNLSTGQELNIPGLTNSTPINRPQTFVQKGKIIASKMPDGRVRKSDRSTGKELEPIYWKKILASDVKFSDDGKAIAVVNWDGVKKVRDISTGRELNSLRLDFPFASSIIFSDDDSTIAAATPNGVKVWNASTGKEIITFKGDTNSSDDWVIENLFFSPDGNTIVTIDNIDPSSELTGVGLELTQDSKNNDLTVLSPVKGSPAEVAGVRSQDIIVKIDAKTTKGMNVNEAVNLIRGPIGSKVVLTVRRGSELLIFPLTRARIGLHEKNTLQGDAQNQTSNRFTNQNQTSNKFIKLWNVQTGKTIETFRSQLNSANDIVFSPDGRTIAFAKTDGAIELRDFSTGKPITTLARHLKQVDRINFSPDGKMLISITGVGLFADEMKLWDLATGQEIKTYKETLGWNIPGRNGFLFSPDGKTIFLFDYDGKVTPWNLDLEDLLKRGCDRLRDYPQADEVCGSNK